MAESGLQRQRRAVADAAGWPWCEEHNRPRWDGSDPCDHLHTQPAALCLLSGECVLPLGHYGDCDWGADFDD